MGWLLNRKIKKAKEDVELVDFSVKDVDTFKFNDWFEYKRDGFFPERLCIYWRNRKFMSEQDKAIFKFIDTDYPIGRTGKIKEDKFYELSHDIITNVQKAITKYCKIRETLIDEPYLQNYDLHFQNYEEKYVSYIKLTPFTAMNYLGDVAAHHNDWDPKILTEYRNYIKRLFVQCSKDNKLTGDYPPVDAWTFITWHFKIYLPDLEAKGRTMMAQSFINEVYDYRKELESGENKEKKDKKDKK